MAAPRRLRILVVGDPYCPSSAFRAAFERLAERPCGRRSPTWPTSPAVVPSSPSELGLKEYMGSPAQVIAALDGHDVLVVQGAPVTDAVLDAAPALRLVCCARGGPVNVDVAAATDRGIPVVTTPGKNADAVAELTIAFMVMLARRLPEVIRHVESRRRVRPRQLRGRPLVRPRPGRPHARASSASARSAGGSPPRALRVRHARSSSTTRSSTRRRSSRPGPSRSASTTLLERSDFVSLHARATADNRGLIGPRRDRPDEARAAISSTPPATTLVDEAAVVAALDSGRLAGAALDVVSPSPATGRHPLLAFPNVVIATHIGGATYETLHHGGRDGGRRDRALRRRRAARQRRQPRRRSPPGGPGSAA